MATSTSVKAGTAVSVLLVFFGVLLFVQTNDPMLLLMPVQLVALVWLVVLVVHILRHGIPVRIVADERGPR
ncbi:MAG TPA: hypothetical protein VM582_07605 [Candidatus Thermoplasmatota archaeon]|nr:hypothetical protein [Candidatus Thermoplasmatota archaeon]